MPLGFEFKLQGYTRTIDATFSDITREEYNSTALDEKLYMGDLETLNVYIHQSLGGLGGVSPVFSFTPTCAMSKPKRND